MIEYATIVKHTSNLWYYWVYPFLILAMITVSAKFLWGERGMHWVFFLLGLFLLLVYASRDTSGRAK